jgi:DNA polymerase-3 subunit chi
MQATLQWLHRAWNERKPVLIYAPDQDVAQRLDRMLWSIPALSFLPHCHANSPLASQTPIVLTDSLDTPPQEACLLNLSNELPPTFSRFETLVEIVSTSDDDRLPARERFKFYRDRGYPIVSQDISGGL